MNVPINAPGGDDPVRRTALGAVLKGIAASQDGDRVGVYGTSDNNIGVYAQSNSAAGLYATGNPQAATLDGDVEISGKLTVKGTWEAPHEIHGNMVLNGDIQFTNGGDFAEDFTVGVPAGIEPGAVVVFGPDGCLFQSETAYDKRVAGVVSGAGDYKPGIVLDRKSVQASRRPVALVGKVFCKADASQMPIEVGDLLTTSPTPGHAMKATDSGRAFGAVIGKALGPLTEGRDLIPILVALQ